MVASARPLFAPPIGRIDARAAGGKGGACSKRAPPGRAGHKARQGGYYHIARHAGPLPRRIGGHGAGPGQGWPSATAVGGCGLAPGWVLVPSPTYAPEGRGGQGAAQAGSSGRRPSAMGARLPSGRGHHGRPRGGDRGPKGAGERGQ